MRQSTTRPSAEETAVRDVYQQVMQAWNRGSGAGLAEVFTEDGHLVGFDGTHLRGGEEIGPFHQRLFDRWLKGSRLVGEVTDVRFLGPDVAVLHAVGGTVLRGKHRAAPERDSIQTLVASRQPGGDWRLAAFQNTRLRVMGAGVRPFLLWTLSDWLWKVLRASKQRTYSAPIRSPDPRGERRRPVPRRGRGPRPRSWSGPPTWASRPGPTRATRPGGA